MRSVEQSYRNLLKFLIVWVSGIITKVSLRTWRVTSKDLPKDINAVLANEKKKVV